MRILPVLAVLALPATAFAQEGPAAPPAEGPAAPVLPVAPEPEALGDAEPAPPGHDGTVGEPIAASSEEVGVYAPMPSSLRLRKGFFGGAAFGAGGLTADCDGCEDYDAIGFSFDGGWAFSPKWGVLVELVFTGGVGSEELDGDSVAGQIFQFGLAARFWPTDRLWLQAGLASGSFTRIREGADDPLRKASGAGITFAAGIDLWRSASRHIVVDLRCRLGFFGLDQDSGTDTFGQSYDATQKAVMAGVNWY
jgi:hypothetical protein